jgi:hypoxanthine phosphoribosyltransferase
VLEPDFIAWEAPPRYLVGYGMDMEGRYRGLPFIAAAD